MLESPAIEAIREEYPHPVGQLLTVGDAYLFEAADWPNYAEKYELGHEHVPALIRMACDLTLHTVDLDAPEVWAPVHAWRALAQMRATEAIEPLLEFMKIPLDDDAVAQEFPTIFGMMGPAAIPPIAAFLRNRNMGWMPASLASAGLEEIVKRHPESRGQCVGILTQALANAADRDPEANGFMIGNLLDMAAIEAIDTIREAFRLDAVDQSIAGDLEDIEIELGIRERRTTPRPHYGLASRDFPSGVLASGSRPPEARYNDTRHGVFEQPGTAPKIGRNETCPCGSGKKYKKCCLEQGQL